MQSLRIKQIGFSVFCSNLGAIHGEFAKGFGAALFGRRLMARKQSTN